MGWWGAKTLLTWTEPRLARETREALAQKDTSALGRILWGLAIGLLIVFRLGIKFRKRNNWPIVLIIALLAAAGFVFVWPRLKALFPSVIQVTEKSIAQSVGNRSETWKFDDLASWRLILPTDEESPPLLALQLKAGATVILGVGPEVNLDELQYVLNERAPQA